MIYSFRLQLNYNNTLLLRYIMCYICSTNGRIIISASIDNLDLAIVSTRIALRDFPCSRAYDAIDKRKRSFPELRKFLLTKIIFIIALLLLFLQSFLLLLLRLRSSELLNDHRSHHPWRILIIRTRFILHCLCSSHHRRIRPEFPPASVLISDSGICYGVNVYFLPILFASRITL